MKTMSMTTTTEKQQLQQPGEDRSVWIVSTEITGRIK
jgi:hypothetical protein